MTSALRATGDDEYGAGMLLGSYSVLVNSQAIGGTTTFVHEVAHSLGAHHPAIQGDATGPGYARGYVGSSSSGTGFRTIMSNGTGCEAPCLELAYFSNPSIRIDPATPNRRWSPTGVQIGQAGTADNARRMREQSGRIAGFATLKCPGSAPAGCSGGGSGTGGSDQGDEDPPVVVK